MNLQKILAHHRSMRMNMMKKVLSGLVLAWTIGTMPFSQVTASPTRPNIVFVMTDDQRWDGLGCYGRKDVLTPHIDKLASEGVIFDHAYYAVAICMPSRVTMFTGRYFSDHKVGFTYPYNRTLPNKEFNDSYPSQLRQAGYRTGFIGKFGIRLDKTGGLVENLKQHFDFFVGRGKPTYPNEKDDEAMKHIYRKERSRTERTIIKGDAMIRFLETQPKGQPFCLSISFDAVKNDKDADMYPPHVELFKDKKMWVPENWSEGENTKLPAVLDHWRGTKLHLKATSTPELYQRVARRFAVQGYTVDQQVGRLMSKLEDMGVLNNTIVIYTSDNGRFHGAHGLFDKAILYDESMKAPLIIYDGRTASSKKGHREQAMVSSVDMAPTILSMAGLEVPKSMQGKDLSALLKGKQDMSQWRDTVLLESLILSDLLKKSPEIAELNNKIIAENRSYRARGVRTDRYKYFKYFEQEPVIEELYDLKVDPYEQNNLADHPEYTEILTKLRTETENLYNKVKSI